MQIAVVANTAWYLVNFRLNLMESLIKAGHTIVAISSEDDNWTNIFRNSGVIFESIKISGSGTNPLKEIFSIASLCYVFKKHSIQIVLSYTPKGNIYSAIAAIICGILFVPNISGQGRTFVHRSFITRVVKVLYRFTLHRSHRVFFQNYNDLEQFVAAGLVARSRCERLPGSGVDLTRFIPEPLPKHQLDAPTFLLAARLLWDKGVGEFVAVARRIKVRYPKATFQLMGFLDVDNRSAVSRDAVELWIREGWIQYLGSTSDVRPFIVKADCLVLPSSYGEGVPRILLEAAATMRPIITTDTAGCRDTVEHGVTGYLCRVKDIADLEHQINSFINLSFKQREQMALLSRQKIEKEFDEKFVINAYINLLNSLNIQHIKN